VITGVSEMLSIHINAKFPNVRGVEIDGVSDCKKLL